MSHFDALLEDLRAIETAEDERDRREKELEMRRFYNNREAELEADAKGKR